MTTGAAVNEDVGIDLVAPSYTEPARDAVLMVERVAKIVSGITVIGEARNALSAAGWTATIAGNRITVGEEVLAQYIPAKGGAFGLAGGHWVIYSLVTAHPVWIVGAERSDGGAAHQRPQSQSALREG